MKFNPTDICSPDVAFDLRFRDILKYQSAENPIYGKFTQALGFSGVQLDQMSVSQIPLLPVEAFRDARVFAAGSHPPEIFFRSSGTSSMIRSSHHVAYASQYEASIFAGMSYFYDLSKFVVLGYTPGYNENPNSSLIWMIQALIQADPSGLSRFLSIGAPPASQLLDEIRDSGRYVMLFGAAFGLADLAESHCIHLPQGSVVMETGGMKTWRREMSRADLHQLLARGFGLPQSHIHSEYGMTELLSQAYAKGDQWFMPPPWMKVTIRDPYNPLCELPDGQPGLIGVVDLANWASCPFILTGDRGVRRSDGAFEVLGRWSSYHLRGCNFLLED
jgi:hypothetical protein